MAKHIAAIMGYTEVCRVALKESDEPPGECKPEAVINVRLRQGPFHPQTQLITLTDDAAQELIVQLVRALRRKK